MPGRRRFHSSSYRTVQHAPQWHGVVELWQKGHDGHWHSHFFSERPDAPGHFSQILGPHIPQNPSDEFLIRDSHGWHYVHVNDHGFQGAHGYNQDFILSTPTTSAPGSTYQHEDIPRDSEIPHHGDPGYDASHTHHSSSDEGASYQAHHSSYDADHVMSYDSYDHYDSYDSDGSADTDDGTTTWQG
jgi:hypothetical protein